MMADTQKSNDATQQPIYWFAIWERTAAQGDYERAAQAQRELARLGVIVRPCRPENQEATPCQR